MDRVIFGDNQFFGIDHLSEEKGFAKALKFKDDADVIDMLNQVYDLGIKTFMCTTHERMDGICDYYRNNPQKYSEFNFYPCMPYAHKYANAATEHGVMGALKLFSKDRITSTITAGLGAATGDLAKIMELLIDVEMKPFRGLNTPIIFLQSVFTDLLLGMGSKEFFITFINHIQNKYNAKAGFITMNLPKLSEFFSDADIKGIVICSSINAIGFRMPGGLKEYEKCLATNKHDIIAMQVLAAGAISPQNAIEYICKFKNINSIIFGASTMAHIKETKNIIERLSTI